MAGGKIDILINPDTKDFTSKLERGLSGVTKVAAGAATAIGGVFAVSGFKRLSQIEEAEASLRGLGHSASEVSGIMDNALAAVQGTAFGMGDAAKVAQNLVAANVGTGKELEGTLRLVADAATIAGTDLASMGSIFTKVATDGRLQGDVIAQLGDRGINILAALSNEFGVAADEARKMASDSEISFEMFTQAMESAMGGAAEAAGRTVKGSWELVGAAIGRVGAELGRESFQRAPGILISIADGIDALTPAAQKAGGALGRALDEVGSMMESASGAMSDFFASSAWQSRATQMGETFSALGDAAGRFVPVAADVAMALAQVAGAAGAVSFDLMIAGLNVAASSLELVAGPLQSVAGFLEEHPGLVATAGAAWLAWKTVPGVLEPIRGAFEKVRTRAFDLRQNLMAMQPTFQGLRAWSKETGTEMSRLDVAMHTVADTTGGTMQKMAQSYVSASAPLKAFAQSQRAASLVAVTGAQSASNAWDAADRTLASAGHSISASVTSWAGTVKGVGAASLTGLKSAATGVMNLFGGPWGIALMAATAGVTALINANQSLRRGLQSLAEITRLAIDAQDELRYAVAGTAGALTGEGLEQAVTVVKGSIGELIELGEAYSGWMYRVDTDTNVWERLLNIDGQWQKDKQAAREIREAYAELEDVLSSLSYGIDDVHEIVAQGGPVYDELIASLRASGEHGQRAADQLESARAEIEALVESGRKMPPAFAEGAQAIDVLADSASFADEKLASLEKMMQIMGLRPKDTQRAMLDAADAIREVEQAAAELASTGEHMGQALFLEDGSLDWTSESVSVLATEMDKLYESLENVAVNGGDVHAAFGEMEGALAGIQSAWGLTDEQMQKVIESFGLMPDKIETVLALEGADDAEKMLFNIIAQLEGMPDNHILHIEHPGDEIVDSLQRLGVTVRELPDGRVGISINDVEVSAALDALGIKTTSLPDGRIEVTDTTPQNLANLAALGIEVEKDRNGRVIISDNAKVTADNVRAQLDGLTTQGKHIVTEERRITYWEQQGYSRSQAAKIQGPVPVGQTGGRFTGHAFSLPAYASGARHGGYRLPSTGPGTEIADGFLALDQWGMPTARLDKDEWVINGVMSGRYDRELAEINAGVFPKLPGYAAGRRPENSADAANAPSLSSLPDEATAPLDLASALGTAIGDIPEEKTASITVEAAGAKTALADVTTQLAAVPDSLSTTLAATTTDLVSAIGSAQSALGEISDEPAVAEIDGDIEPLEEKVTASEQSLESLGGIETVPVADLDNDPLLDSTAESGDQLDWLDGLEPVPAADLNHDALDAGVAHSEAELRRVGSSKATSVADVDNTSALTNINNVLIELDKMPVERVIKVVAHGTTGFSSGGKLPAYAAGARHGGYKLPTSGPGTDTVDGFLAFDSAGMPSARLDAGEWVINAESSAKYDRELAEINAGTFQKLPGYASGGKLGQVSPEQLLNFAQGAMVLGQQAARSLQGAAYVWSGVNWGDCSGAMSGLARFAVGMEAFAGRFATGNQAEALAALGFRPGLGDPKTSFNLGWYNGGPWGGHTSGDIGGVAVEMGGGAGGQGKIGGAAASSRSASYTNHAYLPLGELVAIDYFVPTQKVTSTYQPAPDPSYATEGGHGIGPGGLGISHTSAGGVTFDNGQFVTWDRLPKFATGGRIPHMPGARRDSVLAVSGEGTPHAWVDPGEWVINRDSSQKYDRELEAINAGTFPRFAAGGRIGGVVASGAASFQHVATQLSRAAHELERAAWGLNTSGDALASIVGRGNANALMHMVNMQHVGGDWARNSEKVRDAEAELADVRAKIADENQKIAEAERAVAEAQAENSEAALRKVADAEKDVAKAREEGDAEKVADAEEKLARAREDLAADGQKQAEALEKAEADLAEARGAASTQAQRLAEAERGIIAARFEVISDNLLVLGEALNEAAGGLSSLFGVLADQAAVMERTRQQLIAERIEQQQSDLQAQRARLDAVIAERDIARVRAHGAIAVADAEADLEAARAAAALKGATSVDAMSRALDRARVTGIFAVEDVAQSVIDNASGVRAAQFRVEEARAQALADELEATHRHRLQVLGLAEATLAQQQAVMQLDISTRQLQQQAAILGGLTAHGAQRASAGWSGVGQASGGAGQLLGGLAAGAAGFAMGGPLGALLGGGPLVVKGLADLIVGARQAHKNREEIAESWEGMELGDKIVTGIGLALGGGVAVGGAVAGASGVINTPNGPIRVGGGLGADFTAGAVELGGQIASGAANYVGSAIDMDLERINSLADEERALLSLEVQKEMARIQSERLRSEMDYAAQSTALAANVEIAQLLGRIAEADTPNQVNALADAALVAAERRDEMINILSRQLDITEKAQSGPRHQIQINIPPSKPAPTWEDFDGLIDTMNKIQSEVEIRKTEISGADYLAART